MNWEEAIAEEKPSHLFALFSGGHDSLCSTHIAAQHPLFSGAVHINTGIGIEATRQFVRDTCRENGWPLLEMHPDDKTYEELVLEKGFPFGPKSHHVMYYYLKQRQIRRLVKEHKTGHYDRIGLVTGVRKFESNRRMEQSLATQVRRHGAQLWLNPILEWSDTDKNNYIEENGLKRNLVVDILHKSAECLCGAYARRENEWADIKGWFPKDAEKIEVLEAKVDALGHKGCRWGARILTDEDSEFYKEQWPLCSSCA